jgi:hypothetical protein
MSLPLRELVDHPELVNERAQALDWDELLYDYERALDDDLALLAGLSEAQIHFKPTPEEFSICEVLTHDADSDRLFWMWVKLLIEDRRDEINPADLISGDGANNVIGLEALRGEIEACRALARTLIDARPDTPALTPTSPHPYFGELNGKGWIYFMALHHGIHLRQCARVIAARGFPPQVAILGVDTIEPRPGRQKSRVVFIDHIGLALTCDHQVIDGAPGARFLKVLREQIETIESIVDLKL